MNYFQFSLEKIHVTQISMELFYVSLSTCSTAPTAPPDQFRKLNYSISTLNRMTMKSIASNNNCVACILVVVPDTELLLSHTSKEREEIAQINEER